MVKLSASYMSEKKILSTAINRQVLKLENPALAKTGISVKCCSEHTVKWSYKRMVKLIPHIIDFLFAFVSKGFSTCSISQLLYLGHKDAFVQLYLFTIFLHNFKSLGSFYHLHLITNVKALIHFRSIALIYSQSY